MPTNISENTVNDMHLNERECDRDDYSYDWPMAGEGEEVQWALMAKDGIITEEEAADFIAHDAFIAKARLARRRPSRMTEVNRLKFMRNLSFHGLPLSDLANAPAPRPNRGFAQRLLDDAVACAG